MTRLEPRLVAAAKRELEIRRKTLVRLAQAPSTQMDPLDRHEIIKYLADGLQPERPDDVPSLMKAFLKSCYSYAVLRKFSTSILGEIPTPDRMGGLLESIFAEKSFLEDQTWFPQNLKKVAWSIQQREKYDLTSKQPRPRMVRVMLDGSDQMARRLDRGLNSFYESIEQVSASTPEAMWSFVEEFAKPIYNVGPALICDFVKEIGFLRFVKVDHHFLHQFPGLLGETQDCSRLSEKKHFVLSQQLADALGIQPYYLDRILYEWGRYGR